MALTPFCVVMSVLFVTSLSVGQNPRPPSVTSLTCQDYFNDHILAECVVSGFPPPSIIWMKDDQVLDISGRMNLKHGRINISRATVNDEGIYYCVANNTYGASRSSPQKIMKSVLPAFPTKETESVNGKAGNHLKLMCRDLPESHPRPALKDFSWYIGKKEITQDQRVTVDQLGNLHFLPLRVEDKSKNNVTYNCSVFNAESRARVYGSPTNLTVTDGTPQKRSPNIVYATPNTTVGVGDRLEIQCIADGHPRPEVTWIPPVGSLGARHQVEMKLYSLSVRKAKKHDGGIYICTAKNAEGETRHTIHVTVIDKLLSHIEPATPVLPEGLTQKFKCEVNEADGNITWLINNNPVTEDERVYVSGNTLTVKNVKKPRDMFSIQCHVTKDKRAHVSDATLTVIEPIKTEPSTKSRVDIAPGEKGHLKVNVTVDPDYQDELTYTWYHGGTELNTSNPVSAIKVYRENGSSHLTINLSKLTKKVFADVMGEYVCEVSVGVPKATKRLKFIVTSLKAGYTGERPVTAEAPLWWLAIVCAVLLIAVVVLLIIYLQYRNRGEVYPVDKRERQAGHDPVKELADDNRMQELNRTEEDYESVDQQLL